MTDTITDIVPADAWHLPSAGQLAAALQFVRSNLDDNAEAKSHGELPQAFFGPETRFATSCPACSASLDVFQFTGGLGDTYDAADAKMRSLPFTTPCCHAVVQATDFDFPIVWADEHPDEPEWKHYNVAGFARAAITLWNFPRLISAAERDQISALMSCPVKLLWYGI